MSSNPSIVTAGSAGQFLTPAEVANMLRVKLATLATWRSSGRHDLPFVKVGARVMYDADAVRNWCAARSGTSCAQISAREPATV
jgi:predicted site-specific integrase-resolvase